MKITNISYQNNYSLEGANNVSISDIDSIPNFSEAHINISFMNLLSKDQAINILSLLCNKLKHNAKLTFRLLDWDQMISNYHNGDLSKDEICQYISSIKCLLDRSNIIEIFHKNTDIDIDQITFDGSFASYTVIRSKL